LPRRQRIENSSAHTDLERCERKNSRCHGKILPLTPTWAGASGRILRSHRFRGQLLLFSFFLTTNIMSLSKEAITARLQAEKESSSTYRGQVSLDRLVARFLIQNPNDKYCPRTITIPEISSLLASFAFNARKENGETYKDEVLKNQ
jgi:hypothetical protein